VSAASAAPSSPPAAAAVIGAEDDWLGARPEDDEPPVPAEVEAQLAAEGAAPTVPTAAEPGRVLSVRFGGAAPDQLVAAMQTFRQLMRERPGETRVLIHVPAPGGSALPMELRPVAYDAELLAEIRRRLGDTVDFNLL
jgi:hypothetical protein